MATTPDNRAAGSCADRPTVKHQMAVESRGMTPVRGVSPVSFAVRWFLAIATVGRRALHLHARTTLPPRPSLNSRDVAPWTYRECSCCGATSSDQLAAGELNDRPTVMDAFSAAFPGRAHVALDGTCREFGLIAGPHRHRVGSDVHGWITIRRIGFEGDTRSTPRTPGAT